MDPATGFLLAKVGTSLLSGIFGAGAKRDEAKRQLKLVGEEINALTDFRENLEGIYGERKRFATDRFGNTLDTLGDRLNLDLSQTRREAETLRRRSGLEYSGGLEQDVNRQGELIREGGRKQFEDTGMTFQESQMELEFDKSRQLGEIDTRITQLQSEAELLRKQRKERFLGIF